MEILKRHSEFELLWLKHEPVMSLPGLEIDPAHRKVYCDDQEISLTAKEYDLLCLLATNKGRVREVGYCFEADSECIAAT